MTVLLQSSVDLVKSSAHIWKVMKDGFFAFDWFRSKFLQQMDLSDIPLEIPLLLIYIYIFFGLFPQMIQTYWFSYFSEYPSIQSIPLHLSEKSPRKLCELGGTDL